MLKEIVIPKYPFMSVEIRDNKAFFPDEWDQIFSALKEADILALFVPSQYGGKKVSEQDIYLIMEPKSCIQLS